MQETSKRLEKVWSEHQDRLAKENRELVKMALETERQESKGRGQIEDQGTC
jgi:hypothetical protein